jgi:hypothetical protein
MNPDSTQNLVHELVQDLHPVRRIPRLRTSGVAILVLWLGLLGYQLRAVGLREDFWGSFAEFGPFLAVSFALLVAGGAASLAGLAAGTPGREVVRNWGGGVAAAGVALAIGVCAASILGLGFAYGSPVSADGMCLRGSLELAVLPTAALVFATSRGWAGRPYVAAAIALLGAAACGAFVVHVCCPELGPRHLLLGHLGAPVLWVSLGVLPLGYWLRRSAR